MRDHNFIVFLLCVVLISSCASKSKIVYLQNSKNIDLPDYKEYTLAVDDILKIDILSSNDIQFVSSELKPQNGFINNKENLLYNGYKIDVNGFIDFPDIGVIKAIGMTVNELKKYIHDKLVFSEIFLNPIIDIKILNTHFTILGEVKNPGRYEYLGNNLNIFEAIGFAGDLTINGKRSNVKILREIGDNLITEIDLTNPDFIKDENFQIFSGDIIIISPNSARIKNAGIIGNSGTLLSLLSFILSSIIVINSN